MNDKEDGDLFETDEDQDITKIEEDVIKSIRKRHGRNRPDWLENEHANCRSNYPPSISSLKSSRTQ